MQLVTAGTFVEMPQSRSRVHADGIGSAINRLIARIQPVLSGQQPR
jgi:hypothetical protein